MKHLIIFDKIKNEKGIAIVYVVILLVVFLGMAAFAIDIGYHTIVRNQLQNAVDAAALAGCNHLYERKPYQTSATPLWDIAKQKASDAIDSLNTADNKMLFGRDTAIDYGWWDLTLQSLASSTSTPSANSGPAIRVNIVKTSGKNNGPIANFFAGIFGVKNNDSNAIATAIAASPGSVRPSALIPFAIPRAVADLSKTKFRDINDQIAIYSYYFDKKDTSLSRGQWTPFIQENSVTETRLAYGNNTFLNIDQNIWIQNGDESTLYDNKNHPSLQRDYAGKYIVFPVIDALPDGLPDNAKLVGYIGFYLACAGSGCNGQTPDGKKNEPILMGYFITLPDYGGGPLGPNYGLIDRCRLCQ